MKAIPLIRASVAIALGNFLREIGAPIDRLSQRSGLPSIEWLAPDQLIPLRCLTAFFELAAADQSLNDLGIRLAQRFGFAAAGAFGQAIRNAPTLRAALATARDRVPNHNSAAQYWTVVEGDSVRLCRRFRDTDRDFRQADLFTVALMVDLVRSVAGPGWSPAGIELQSRGPTPRSRLEAFPEALVETSRPVTSITFPRVYLSARLPRPTTGEASTPSPAGLAPPPADLLSSLEIVVETVLQSRRVDIVSVALASGWSVRSLQRRLERVGINYSEVVERVRSRIACELLRDEGVKVIDVGFAVGYSDPAHFTRAFRRWTSLSPIEYRRLKRTAGLDRRSA